MRMLQHMKSKMMRLDGISPTMYQWFHDEVVSKMPTESQCGHLVCDKMSLESGVIWNTQSHKLVGFVTEASNLNLLDKLRALDKISTEKGKSTDLLDDSNANAKKVNQWHLRKTKKTLLLIVLS